MKDHSMRDEVEDRLVDLELEMLHGDVGPDLRDRVHAALQTGGAALGVRPRRAWRGWLAAALFVGGVGVVWAVAANRGGEPKTDAASSPEPGVDRSGEGRALQDPDDLLVPVALPPATTVASLGALARVPADCRALRWTEPRFAPDELSRLRDLEYLHLDCGDGDPNAVVTRVRLKAVDAIEMARRLPKLRRLHLEDVDVGGAAQLSELAALPGLVHLELSHSKWSGSLGGLEELTGLRALDLRSGRLAEGDLVPLRSLVGLRHLGVSRLAEIDGPHVIDALRPLEGLRSLSLWDAYLNADCIELIAAKASIVALELVMACETPKGFVSPLIAEPRWKKLSLGYSGALTAEDLKSLTAMSKVQSLGFGCASTLMHHWVPDQAFWDTLRTMKSVKTLDLSLACGVEPATLDVLEGMPIERIIVSLPHGDSAEVAEGFLRSVFPEVKQVVFAGFPEMGGRIGEDVMPFGGFQAVGAGGGAELPPDLQKVLREFEAEQEAKEERMKKRIKGSK